MTVLERPSPGARATPDGTAPRSRTRGDTALAVALVATVAVGVAFRTVAGSPLWLDEAISVDIASLPLGDLTDALRQDGHPPLYYVLLHLWTQVFGTGDIAVRSLSSLFSVATLPVAWCLGRRIGSRTTAAVALILFATSPFAIRYATEARMYALVTLLAAVGHLLALRALEAPRLARLVPVALTASALVLTHYWGVWLVAAAIVMSLLAARFDPTARAAHRRVAAALVLGCVPFLAWLPVAVYQSAHTGTPWARSVEPFDAVFDTLLDVGGGKWLGGRLASAVLVATIGLALAGRVVDSWHVEIDLRSVPGVRREAALAALTMILGVGAAVATSSAFQPRYAAVVLPAILLVVAVGVGRVPHPWLRIGAVVVLVVAGVAGSVRAVETPRTQGVAIATALAAEARPDDVIAYCPDQLRPSVERALARPALRAVTFPAGSPPGRINWVDYVERIEASSVDEFVASVLDQAGADGSVWLVWAENYRGFDDDCEEIRVGLGRARGVGQEVVTVDESSYEKQALERFDPR